VDVSDAFMEQDVQATAAIAPDLAGGGTDHDAKVPLPMDALPELDEITGIH
jgi:hypothetical protein